MLQNTLQTNRGFYDEIVYDASREQRQAAVERRPAKAIVI